ncbi:MAG: redox-regulated ATPase YchF [Candidatus Hodarchaeota archaeon]
MLIGIIGKPSSGKSTFLNAACLTNAKTGDYPFTTIEPNLGKGFVKSACVCKELDVEDNPKNSICENGVRFCPVELLDVAGLVPGAHEGKGMGNKFLNDLSRADVLLHIIDISGSLNEKGENVEPGTHDPIDDIKFLEEEIIYWMKGIIERTDWDKFARTTHMQKIPVVDAMVERLSGIGINEQHVSMALKQEGLSSKKINDWDDEDRFSFAKNLQKISKPIIIIANKVDKEEGRKNFEKLQEMAEYKEMIFPCSALAEFYLRTYANKEIIDYTPGESSFQITKKDKLSDKEVKALERIQSDILDVYGSTGIQDAINKAIFDILEYIFVFPVHDPNKFTDHDGRILPDVFLVKKGTKLIDFVRDKIHTDLAKHFIHGINAKNKKRLSEDYEVQPNDVVKIVSAK